MWNPDTNGVVVTRDVIWLKWMFFKQKADEEQFNLEDEDDKIKEEIKAKDKMQSEEEKEDDDVPELLDDTAEDDVKDEDDESVAGETDNQDTTMS